MRINQILYDFPLLDVEKTQKFSKLSMQTFFGVTIFYCSRKNSVEMALFPHSK